MTAKGEEELKASPLTVYYTDVTAMELHCILHDRKTQAGSAHIAGSAFFYAVKPLEYAFQMLLRDTLSCIIICQITELLDRAVTFQMDSNVIPGIFQAVLYKIP